MATAGNGDLKGAFTKFASKGDHDQATSKDITKWCTDAKVFGKACSSNNMDIAFSKVKPKGKTTITMKELGPLITELAKTYKTDKKLADDEAAKKQLTEKLAASSPKAHGTTKISATGGVDKMTDTTQYTGAHKERFDAEGKGKGADGRTDKAANDGYVGGYKGKDSFDSKVGKK